MVTNDENCDKIKIKEYKLFLFRIGICEIKKSEFKRYILDLEKVKKELVRSCDEDFKRKTKDKKILAISKVRTHFRIKKVKSEIKSIVCMRDYECLEDITLKK
ncbi:hypothetical protein [Caldicellulosiruptor morganii]|uniref:Uncharacterized protein n=1 Tax=Caldicellulosiruptor morganii TaxID=1387555 RepID=A0ABY7BLH7_9FIRM|nr:hypothetical protein [Caldicellulosiruptor morganii]WAM32906.1 hypothetical protein OTK00_001358 [Caldicellulosiruptor morganii]